MPWSMPLPSMRLSPPAPAVGLLFEMERFLPSKRTGMVACPSEEWMGRHDWPLRLWTALVAARRDVMVYY